MIYLDSSALLKLLFQERESDSLANWLADHGASPVMSSELATVEVLRACQRLDRASLPAARLLMRQLDLVPLSGEVVELAGAIEGASLRSLDALHLASALVAGPALERFVAYDRRLLTAAESVDLRVSSPGW